MGRRSMKHCALCENEEIEAKVIGYYYLPKHKDGSMSGDIPVCIDCAKMVEKVGFPVTPLKGFDNHEFFGKANSDIDIIGGRYKHAWRKVNLVTREDMTDLWRCEKCKGEKATRLGRPDFEGCHIA